MRTHGILATICVRLILLLTLNGLLGACGSAPPAQMEPVIPTPLPIRPTTTLTIKDMRDRWLQGHPCQAPCWEGITPGQTTMTEALAILNRHPLVTNLRFYVGDTRPEDRDDWVMWQWQGSDRMNGEFGILWQNDPPLVAWIVLYPDQPYTLGEIIAAQGDPDAVAPILSTDGFGHGFDITVIYQTKGFALRTRESWMPGVPLVIAPDLVLENGVTFFPPTNSAFSDVVPAHFAWRHNDLVPWQGFQPFAAYCRQVRPSEEYTDNICPKIDIDI